MKTILVVDDDTAILEVLQMFLNTEGFRVYTRINGDKFKDGIDKCNPDLIILDIWLPGIHGDTLANWLKSEDLYKDIPIILMSASNDAQRIAKTCQADACIDKPFEIDDLMVTINNLLN